MGGYVFDIADDAIIIVNNALSFDGHILLLCIWPHVA